MREFEVWIVIYGEESRGVHLAVTKLADVLYKAQVHEEVWVIGEAGAHAEIRVLEVGGVLEGAVVPVQLEAKLNVLGRITVIGVEVEEEVEVWQAAEAQHEVEARQEAETQRKVEVWHQVKIWEAAVRREAEIEVREGSIKVKDVEVR